MSEFDAIDNALNVESSIVPSEDTPKSIQKREEKTDISKDYEYTRANLYSLIENCLLYTSPSPRDRQKSRMPSSA